HAVRRGARQGRAVRAPRVPAVDRELTKVRLLLFLLLTTLAHASSLHGIVVHLRARGDKEVLLLDRDDELGVPRAHAFFRKHFPGTHEGMNCWRLLALMREPATRAKIQEIMEVAG